MRHLLVLGILLKVPRRIPLPLITIPVPKHAVLDEEDGKRAVGDDLAGLANRNIVARHVLAERGAGQAEADRLAQREVDERELGLPLLDREPVEHVRPRLRRPGAVPRDHAVHLLAQPRHPLRVLRQEDLQVAGVDAAVQLAREQRADLKLPRVSLAFDHTRAGALSSRRRHRGLRYELSKRGEEEKRGGGREETYPYDVTKGQAAIHEELQGVVALLTRLLALVDDLPEDEGELGAVVQPQEVVQRGQPGEDDLGERVGLLEPVEDGERVPQQLGVLGDVVGAHGPHRELVDDLVQALERVRDPPVRVGLGRRRRGQRLARGAGVAGQQVEVLDEVVLLHQRDERLLEDLGKVVLVALAWRLWLSCQELCEAIGYGGVSTCTTRGVYENRPRLIIERRRRHTLGES